MVVKKYDKFVKGEGEIDVEPEAVMSAKAEWTADDEGKHKHITKFLEDFDITIMIKISYLARL